MNPALFWALACVALIGIAVLGELVGRNRARLARDDTRTRCLEIQIETLRSETRAGLRSLDAALSAKAEMRHAEILAALPSRPGRLRHPDDPLLGA
ncbi:hypothetical protein [Actinomadura harenae]|uniref:Uncharacterized protein n=1 Tax=Actinomadura harenae TaxID=2483351 RepID=A0A3M2LLV9_9ACTN|nr:hypothetical protein [Actinomadura harenae]RMI38417.1 hypothetical protein EBO15_33030 [Actinomadura harenae]